jgi:hypothetical protein
MHAAAEQICCRSEQLAPLWRIFSLHATMVVSYTQFLHSSSSSSSSRNEVTKISG